MAELLLVRSGSAEAPVTEKHEMDVDGLRRLIGPRSLHYLGAHLPPIGETNRVSELAGPDHVVVNVDPAEAEQLGVEDAGFYVVDGLFPVDASGAVA